MGKQKIDNERIVSKDLFVKQAKSARIFLDVLKDINMEVVDSSKVFKKMVENVSDLDKSVDSIKKVEEAFQGIKKVEKELIDIQEQETKTKKDLADAEKELLKQREKEAKLAKQLKNTNEGRLDQEIKLRLELQKSKKERKEQLLVEGDFLDVYQKTSKRLIQVRKDQKNLATQQKLGVKLTKAQQRSLKDLTEELEELDGVLKDVDASAGQFQREVGNYPKTAGRAKAAFGSLSGFLLGVLVTSFTKSREASRQFQILLEQIGSVSRTVIAGLVTLFENKLLPTIQNFGLVIKKASIEAKLFFKELVPEVLRSGTAKKEISDLTKEVDELGKTIAKNRKLIADTENPLSAKNLKKSADAVLANIKAIKELGIAEGKLADTRARLSVEIERARAQEELFQLTADDSTVSFQNQAEALEKALKFRTDRLKLEQTLAKEELRIAIERVNVNLRENNLAIIRDAADARRLDLFKDFDKADKIQQENLTRLAEGIKQVEAIENEVAMAQQERNKQSREIARDRFEQELDFALDIADRQKSVNERQITSDKLGIDEKFKILVKTENLVEKSFDNQIKLTEKFISESLASQGKGQQEIADILSKINIRTLSELEDEEIVRERLLESGAVDEITQNRIREIIIERKAALQDIVDLQDEVTKQAMEESMTRDEAEQALLQQRKDIAVTLAGETTQERIKDFDESEDFNQKKFDDAIDSLELQKDKEIESISLKNAILLENQENTADDIIRIKEAEVEEIRQIEKKSLEEQQKLRDSANEKRFEEFQKTISKLQELADFAQKKTQERSEERLEGIDKEIAASQKRADRIREITNNSILDTGESLAFEQRKQAELEREREKEQKRQERRELGFTAIKTYTAKVESGDKNALQNTVRDITLLLAAINSLPGFIRGTDHVAKDMKPTFNTGKDDYIFRGDGGEKVFKSEHAKRIGYNTTNESVVRMVEKARNAEISNSIDTNILAVPFQTNDQVLSKFDELKKSVDALPGNMPHSEINYDELAHAIIKTKTKQGKILREHQRIGDLW